MHFRPCTFIPYHYIYKYFMKKRTLRRSVALAFCACSLGASVVCQGQTVQLQEGVNDMFRTAEAHNASLVAVKAAIRESEAGIETARMSKLPEVQGQASVSYLGNARLWNRHFGESTSAPMPHYGNNFLLHAEQVLYAGGAIKGGIKLAEQGAQMSRLDAEEERQRVRFALVSLYLQMHSFHNQQAVYAANMDLAEQQISLMTKRREQGVSLRNDVTRYELQLQQMTLGETSVTDQQDIVRQQLLTALGTDSVSLQLLSESAFDESALEVDPESSWLQLAANNHLGLQKAQLATDMGRTQETLVKADRLPKVALVAEDHLDGPITIEVPPINKNLNYWYVGVGVSYNFSSLYKAKRRLKQAQLNTALAADRKEVLSQQVTDAVHAAYVNLHTAQTALSTCRKSVQLASENYDVVSNRYRSGLALVTDLTDAASMKLDAELALVNARIQLVQNFYALKYAAHAL